MDFYFGDPRGNVDQSESFLPEKSYRLQIIVFNTHKMTWLNLLSCRQLAVGARLQLGIGKESRSKVKHSLIRKLVYKPLSNVLTQSSVKLHQC